MSTGLASPLSIGVVARPSADKTDPCDSGRSQPTLPVVPSKLETLVIRAPMPFREGDTPGEGPSSESCPSGLKFCRDGGNEDSEIEDRACGVFPTGRCGHKTAAISIYVVQQVRDTWSPSKRDDYKNKKQKENDPPPALPKWQA